MSSLERSQGFDAAGSAQGWAGVRDAVRSMLELPSADEAAQPVAFWETALAELRRLLEGEAPAADRPRRLGSLFTGVRAEDYGPEADPAAAARFAAKLAVLRALDVSELFVPEAPAPGAFGFELDGGLVNLDTLRLYESLLAMDRGGALVPLKHPEGRPIVLDVGPGWGGLAQALKRRFPGITLVLLDRPEAFLLSAPYLTGLFPDARIAFLTEAERQPEGAWADYDFVFVPAALAGAIRPERLDLAISTLSFQEMSESTLRRYLGLLARLGCPQLYSLNRERPADSPPRGDLTPLIEEFFWANEVALLDGPFDDLDAQARKEKTGEQDGRPEGVRGTPRKLTAGSATEAASEPARYRHLVAWRKYRRP